MIDGLGGYMVGLSASMAAGKIFGSFASAHQVLSTDPFSCCRRWRACLHSRCSRCVPPGCGPPGNNL